MKFKSKEDIWNAIVEKISDIDYPTHHPLINHAYILFQYYSQMESGGHEDVLNWLINQKKVDQPLEALRNTFLEASATSYAAIIEKYGPKMVEHFQMLEQNQPHEEDFYQEVKRADVAYWNLNDFHQIVEKYFYKHCEDLLQ